MRGGARPGAVVLGPSALARVSLHMAAVRWRTVWPGAHCLTPEPGPPRERGGTAHKKWRVSRGNAEPVRRTAESTPVGWNFEKAFARTFTHIENVLQF